LEEKKQGMLILDLLLKKLNGMWNLGRVQAGEKQNVFH
jgi:hypothetical protein